MAAKQMEEIQKKLERLSYARANAPAQSLLFAGMERYALLEWLFFKLLGDKSPFSQQNLQGDAGGVRDEETVRIQYLAEIAKFLGFTPTVDIEAIQGHGTYEDRMEMLRNIVDLVEASLFSDNPEWSIDEQVAKDIQLIDAIAERPLIFSEECKLFPADVQIQSIYPLPGVSELETKLSEQAKILSNLQQKVDDLAAKHAYNPDEEYAEVECELRARLESFLETARAFNAIYTKLHGFGPAANRLLEAYNMLLKFLGNLKNLRDSHAALTIGSSGTVAGEPSSVARIVSECEVALTVLNRDLGILSASIAREQGERL
ncbi:Plant nuclear matrix 1 [Raphanus sativus]|nr:Plant nuclear matrix 1 [Raphanus sativus]